MLVVDQYRIFENVVGLTQAGQGQCQVAVLQMADVMSPVTNVTQLTSKLFHCVDTAEYRT